MTQRKEGTEIGNGKPFWQQRCITVGKQPEGATAADKASYIEGKKLGNKVLLR